jgi:hypothetical protein
MKRFAFFFLMATSLFAQSREPETIPFQITTGSANTVPSAFKIWDQSSHLVLTLSMDGKVTYGDGYTPNEAAVQFWNAVQKYAPYPPGTVKPPTAEWVSDPSAGHYDCPDGWMAFSKSEPDPRVDTIVTANAIYIPPPRDKKGHVLGSQPPPPICILDSK